jgi:hypothetical protein
VKHLVVLGPLLVAGCLFPGSGGDDGPPPIPPPVVDSMTPATGAYGSTITITGSGFGATGTLSFDHASSGVVQSWSDTSIIARVPFPAAAGPVHIKTPGGETDTTTFTPDVTWAANAPAELPTVFQTTALANGGAAVLGLGNLDRVSLVVFAGGTPTTTTLLDGISVSQDDRHPILARLVLDAQGAPVVFATNLDGNVVEFAGGTTVDSGLVGSVMAAGRDATGPYVWVLSNGNFNRARPGAHPFAIDRGPIVDVGALDTEVAADGTLVIARSVGAGTIFDYEACLGVARLAPADTGFVIGETAETMAWDDYIAAAHLQISPDGARMFATYSTQQNNENQDHSQSPVIRGASGIWSGADGILDGRRPIAYLPTATATLDDDVDGGLTLVPDIADSTTDEPLPLWPAEPAALLVDGTTLRPLIQVNNQIWYPTPPTSP